MNKGLGYYSFGKKTLLGIGIILFTIIVQILILISIQMLFEEMGVEVIKFFATSQLLILVIQAIALKYIYDDVRNFSESLQSKVVIPNSSNLLTAGVSQGVPDPPRGYKQFK